MDVVRHLANGDTAFATYVNDENGLPRREAPLSVPHDRDLGEARGGWRLVGPGARDADGSSAVALSAERLREYAGRYALTPELSYEIRLDGDARQGQQSGRKPEALRAEAPDVLFVPGKPRYRYVFRRDAQGQITGLAQRREAWDIVWKRMS
jgi:hypothetical protein